MILLKRKGKGFVMKKKSYLHKKINCVQCSPSLSLRLNRNKYLSHIYRTVGWRMGRGSVWKTLVLSLTQPLKVLPPRIHLKTLSSFCHNTERFFFSFSSTHK